MGAGRDTADDRNVTRACASEEVPSAGRSALTRTPGLRCGHRPCLGPHPSAIDTPEGDRRGVTSQHPSRGEFSNRRTRPRRSSCSSSQRFLMAFLVQDGSDASAASSGREARCTPHAKQMTKDHLEPIPR